MSLWALTNIAAGKHEHTEYLVGQGAAEEFVRIMQSGQPRLREQACWALGNIAGDCAELRDAVLHAGAMPVVLEVLRPEHAKLSAVKTATWTMSNLCRGKPPPAFKDVRSTGLCRCFVLILTVTNAFWFDFSFVLSGIRFLLSF